MKKLLICGAAMFFLLCSCATSEPKQPEPPQKQDTSAAQSTPASSKSVPDTPSPTQTVKTYLEEQGYTVTATKNTSARLEFYTTLPELEGAVAEVPDNWDNIKNALLETAVEASALLPSDEEKIITLYLQDEEENILASVLGDKISYSFDTVDTSTAVDNPPTITLDEFNAIKTGMEYQEVFDIIGGRGEVLSEVDSGLGDEYYTIMFMWEGEGSLGANANVMFQGGKVINKAQFGLE